MSNSGVNTGFAKCFIFFMGVVILFQGFVYLGLSVWGITFRKCSKEALDISSKPFQFALTLIYFLDEDCGNPYIKLPGISETLTLEVDFNKAKSIENRTFIIFTSYAVLSTLWILTSLVVIITICGTITRTVNVLCFWPWFLIVMAGSTLDAVATAYHIHDIMNTTSVVRTFEYLGIIANNRTVEVLSNFDAFFITPGVTMTCISSRVVLIWLLNIFGTSFCLSLSNALSKRNSSKQNRFDAESTAYVTNNRQEPQQQAYPAHNELYQTASASLRTQTQTFTTEAEQNCGPCNVQSPKTGVTNFFLSESPSNERNENINHNNIYIQPGRTNSPSEINVSQYHQQLSPISPLNNRYSTNYESIQFPMQKVSEELRGQLPWSYTSLPPPAPKKHQQQVYPDILVPNNEH